MIGSFHRKNYHPTLIIFGFIVIFQNRDGQTDRQTDNTNIYNIYIYVYIYHIYFCVVCLFVCLSVCLSVCPSRFWKITIKPKIIKVGCHFFLWKEPIIGGVCPEIYSILPLLGRAPGGGIFLVYVTILYVTKCMSRFWKINIKQKLL